MKRTRLILFTILLVMNVAVALSFTATVQAQTSGGCTLYHTVQRGENLYRIARQYGNTVAHIQAFNGIVNPNRIYAGQRLCVWDNSLNPYPQPSDPTYTVQRGDTLFSIARRFGVNLYQLASMNGVWNPSRIYVGQVLRLPAGSPAPTPPPVVTPEPLQISLLSIIESNNVSQSNGVFWIADGSAFFPNVNATGATGVAFYLQDAIGGITLLGEDVNPADGWGVPASIQQNPFWGSIYAIAYNQRGDVRQSNVISVRR